MPSKTNSDIVRDLEKSVATHNERISFLLKGLDTLKVSTEAEQKATRQHISEVNTESAKLVGELAVVQHRIGELERLQRNRVGFFWTLFGIVLGAVLSFSGNLLLKLFS